MNPNTHIFHPTPPHITVSIRHSHLMILKSMEAVSLYHTKIVQTTQWCGLNPQDTNQEHNEQTKHQPWPWAIIPTRTTQKLVDDSAIQIDYTRDFALILSWQISWIWFDFWWNFQMISCPLITRHTHMPHVKLYMFNFWLKRHKFYLKCIYSQERATQKFY